MDPANCYSFNDLLHTHSDSSAKSERAIYCQHCSIIFPTCKTEQFWHNLLLLNEWCSTNNLKVHTFSIFFHLRLQYVITLHFSPCNQNPEHKSLVRGKHFVWIMFIATAVGNKNVNNVHGEKHEMKLPPDYPYYVWRTETTGLFGSEINQFYIWQRASCPLS